MLTLIETIRLVEKLIEEGLVSSKTLEELIEEKKYLLEVFQNGIKN